MMKSNRLRSRLIVLAGGTVLVVMVAVTAACGTGGNQAPSTTAITTTNTTTSPSSAAPLPPAPAEKSINPTGGNLFTPGVKAPPAQTVPPGRHPGINGVP
jgi:hypothetical protein